MKSVIEIRAPKGASEKTRSFAALLQKGKPFESFLDDNSQASFQACTFKLIQALAENDRLDDYPAFASVLGLANHSAAKQSMEGIEVIDSEGKLQSLASYWAKARPTGGSSKLDLSALGD